MTVGSIQTMFSIKTKSDFLRKMFNCLDKHIQDVFLYVERTELYPINNLAERDLRPFVIHRKVSFGSYSVAGGELKLD